MSLTVKRGRTHKYLGMLLDYSVKGQVKIYMQDYIATILKDLPKSFDGKSVTPSNSYYLFEVNKECRKLNQIDSNQFHHVVAQLLFLCKCARPDIQEAVAFLTTCAKSPDEDNQKKLQRCIIYL